MKTKVVPSGFLCSATGIESSFVARTGFLILALLFSAIWVGARDHPSHPLKTLLRLILLWYRCGLWLQIAAARFVDNLKQDDFEILENGKPQRIGFFSLESISAGAVSVPECHGQVNSIKTTNGFREVSADNRAFCGHAPLDRRMLKRAIDKISGLVKHE